MTPVDVLIVGLGPAGAAAAEAAARAGATVLAIDRKAQAGLPVQCAEFVPRMISTDTPHALPARVQDIDRMVTRLGDATQITADFQGHMIDRARFDQALVNAARTAGADCRFGLGLRRLTADGAILTDGSQRRARVVIGADGPHSPVGAAIGSPNRALLETRQITVALHQPFTATDIFLHPDYLGGYAWLFPKGNRANLGLGIVPHLRLRLKPLLTALHADLLAQGRVGADIVATTGGAIPVGGITALRGQIGDTPVLLAGDAAGLTHPITGAGIATAIATGKMAGEAAALLSRGREDAAVDYEDEVRATWGRTLTQAVARRHDLLSKPATPAALRRAWIAYPEYWADAAQISPTALEAAE